MKILKALYETAKWALMPHCDHKAGVCIGGQGRRCKFVKDTKTIDKDGVKIQRTDYLINGEDNDHH